VHAGVTSLCLTGIQPGGHKTAPAAREGRGGTGHFIQCAVGGRFLRWSLRFMFMKCHSSFVLPSLTPMRLCAAVFAQIDTDHSCVCAQPPYMLSSSPPPCHAYVRHVPAYRFLPACHLLLARLFHSQKAGTWGHS
jgi:hypothetical protein